MTPSANPSHPIAYSDLIVGTKFLFCALLLFLSGIALGLTHLLSPVTPNSNNVIQFEVLNGWGASHTSRQLETAGLVRNGKLFSIMLRIRNLDTKIGAGLYELHQGMSAHQISNKLMAGGKPRTIRVLLPEGLRDNEVAQTLAASGLGNQEEFFLMIREPRNFRKAYIPENLGLEGFLFPASYEIPVKSTTEEVLGFLLNRFDQEITPDVASLLLERNLSIIEWVILASIVQTEAGNDDEMKIIAGVFLNRLDQGMPLQSDPTVAYGLNKQLPALDIRAGDFEQDHEWNTYTRSGLPSTPISNPGQVALLAVLSPQRLDSNGLPYFYFLHGFDGDKRVFRPNVNLANHNRDRNKYLQQ